MFTSIFFSDPVRTLVVEVKVISFFLLSGSKSSREEQNCSGKGISSSSSNPSGVYCVELNFMRMLSVISFVNFTFSIHTIQSSEMNSEKGTKESAMFFPVMSGTICIVFCFSTESWFSRSKLLMLSTSSPNRSRR